MPEFVKRTTANASKKLVICQCTSIFSFTLVKYTLYAEKIPHFTAQTQ